MKQPRPRCLVIADDLTGGADTGAQFAKRGLRTILISLKDHPSLNLSEYLDSEVLVVNTDSRGLRPGEAYSLLLDLMRTYDPRLFPLVYKKVDSTLRGNIGGEIDALFDGATFSLGFFAPSFPEQQRTLVDGVLRVRGIPLALTEAASDTVSPVTESRADKLLGTQSHRRIARIDLSDVAEGKVKLRKAIEAAWAQENQLILFDAAERKDLRHIAEAGFDQTHRVFFIGSAGLAGEVARELAPSTERRVPLSPHTRGAARHVLIISGSASTVTHQQLNRLEKKKDVQTFELTPWLIHEEETEMAEPVKELAAKLWKALSRGHALLRTCSARLSENPPGKPPVHVEIARRLGQIVFYTLEASDLPRKGLSLLIVGGDTMRSVLDALQCKKLEILGEITTGVVMSQLMDGVASGLPIVTKAGAFGKEDTLERVVKSLESGEL